MLEQFPRADYQVRFDNDKYSVAANALGRTVEVHAYADRVVIRQDGRVFGAHRRSFGCGGTFYDPWHYVPVVARKPGALRNGAPFKDWVLPAAMECIRLAGSDDGSRQMVKILAAVMSFAICADRTQRMIRRHPPLHQDVAEKSRRSIIFAAHCNPPSIGIKPMHAITLQPPRKTTFSAAC